MYLLILGVGLTIFFVVSLRKPLIGLFVMLLAIQVEYFFLDLLPNGITLGRLTGIMALLGWLANRSGFRRSLFFKPAQHGLVIANYFFLVAITAGAVISVDPGSAISQVIRIFMLLALAIMIIDLVRTQHDLITLFWVASLGGAFGAGIAIIQYLGYSQGGVVIGNIYETRQGVRLEGLTSNANTLGIHLITAAPFLFLVFFTSKNMVVRAVFLGLITMFAFALVLTVSRSNIFPFAAFVISVFTLRRLVGLPSKGSTMVIVTSLAVLILSITTADVYVRDRIMRPIQAHEEETSMQARMEILVRGFEFFMENPLVGVGLANTRYHSQGPSSHDTISTLFGETGAIGTLAFLSFFMIVVQRQLSLVRRARRYGDAVQMELAIMLLGILFVLFLWVPVKIILYQRLFWLWVGLVLWMDARLPTPVRKSTISAYDAKVL